MSDLRGYLKELTIRQEALQSIVSVLGPALEGGAEQVARSDQVARLEEVAKRVRLPRNLVVVDWDAPLLMRSPRNWAVIGAGGVPNDVKVVDEYSSLEDSGKVLRPDLEGYRKTGKVVINGAEFLRLLARLRQEVLGGRLVLPYHPCPDHPPPGPVEAVDVTIRDG